MPGALLAVQIRYVRGLHTCARVMDERHLLDGFGEMDPAPISALLTRLRTDLTDGAP